MLSQAGAATFDYATSAWAVAQRWLRTVDVFVEHSPPEVKVQVNIQPGAKGPRIPGEQRDPGPFLVPARVLSLSSRPSHSAAALTFSARAQTRSSTSIVGTE